MVLTAVLARPMMRSIVVPLRQLGMQGIRLGFESCPTLVKLHCAEARIERDGAGGSGGEGGPVWSVRVLAGSAAPSSIGSRFEIGLALAQYFGKRIGSLVGDDEWNICDPSPGWPGVRLDTIAAAAPSARIVRLKIWTFQSINLAHVRSALAIWRSLEHLSLDIARPSTSLLAAMIKSSASVIELGDRTSRIYDHVWYADAEAVITVLRQQSAAKLRVLRLPGIGSKPARGYGRTEPWHEDVKARVVAAARETGITLDLDS